MALIRDARRIRSGKSRPMSSPTGRERYEGYREALTSQGIQINPDYVLDSHWNENEAYSGMLQLLP